MSSYIVRGGKTLSGKIHISGAKNSALKILAASVMAQGKSIIHNVPDIVDISKMEDILMHLGASISKHDSTIEIDTTNINTTVLDPALTRKIRASIVLAGPMLARFGGVTIAEPGGCLIGSRSIEDHLDLLKQFNITVSESDDNYILRGKPEAGEVVLCKMSVTATENAIMAAALSKGVTKIRVAAAEPEIADLANYLNKMGAKIYGAGTHDIEIHGVDKLTPCEYHIMPDRIEAATYIMAALITNSDLEIGPLIPEHLSIVLTKLKNAGASFEIIERNDQKHIIVSKHEGLLATPIDTRTYPGFPTDLQSVYAVLMTQAKGKTRIFETLFESRFGYIEELKRMNAKIEVVSPHIIDVYGTSKLKPQEIDAFDIRGGSALVIAALATKGETVIGHTEMIERGYENMVEKLHNVGADIQRME